MRKHSIVVGLLLAGAMALGAGCSQQQAASPAGDAPAEFAVIDFASQVAPILEERCHECHGGEQVKAGLNMFSLESLFAGGDSGSPVVAGDADASMLIQVVEGTHANIDQMPPKGGPISAAQIATLRAWIDGM